MNPSPAEEDKRPEWRVANAAMFWHTKNLFSVRCFLRSSDTSVTYTGTNSFMRVGEHVIPLTDREIFTPSQLGSVLRRRLKLR